MQKHKYTNSLADFPDVSTLYSQYLENVKNTVYEAIPDDSKLQFQDLSNQVRRRSTMGSQSQRNSISSIDSESTLFGKLSDDPDKYPTLKFLLSHYIPFIIGNVPDTYINDLISNFCSNNGERKLELLGDALLNAKLIEIVLDTTDFDSALKIIPTIKSNAFYLSFVQYLYPKCPSFSADLLEIVVGILHSSGHDFSMVALELKMFYEKSSLKSTVAIDFSPKSALWELVAKRGFCDVHSNFHVRRVDSKNQMYDCTTTFTSKEHRYDGYGTASTKKDAEYVACLEVLRLLYFAGYDLPIEIIESIGYKGRRERE